MLREAEQLLFSTEKPTLVCCVTAAKEEKDGGVWSHGHPKTKTKESETRASSFEELGSKFENTSLTNSPFQSTHSPRSKSPYFISNIL